MGDLALRKMGHTGNREENGNSKKRGKDKNTLVPPHTSQSKKGENY